ncbi:hypothetical protein [Brevundimonas sp. BAL450]|nr:hypothetical protein [Brevundimonas sp. BAL450]
MLLILIGLVGAVSDPSGGSPILGIGLAIAGLAVLPPVVSLIRRRATFYMPMWVPPVTSFVVAFVFAVIGTSVGLPAETGSGAGTETESRGADSAEDRAEQVAEIEGLISEGTVESTRSALRKLDDRRLREDVAEGGSLRPLFDRATAAAEDARVRGEINGYIARLNETLPMVEAVFTGRPETELVINLNLETLNTAARLLRDGEAFASDPQVREAMAELRRTMVQKQTAAFPAMRAGYGAIKDQAVWENDMDIIVQGGGNRTIRFIAGIFAANRNIARFEESVRPVLSPMRFRRSQYEWYRGSEYTYYTLETPDDAEIGYWVGSTFTPVPAPE